MRVVKYLEDPSCSINIRRLRELSISGWSDQTQRIAAVAVKHAANTIISLIWDPPLDTLSPLPYLSILLSLRFLSLDAKDIQLRTIRNVFVQCPLPETIEEITIILISVPYPWDHPALEALDARLKSRNTKTRGLDRSIQVQILVSEYKSVREFGERYGLTEWFPLSCASDRFIGRIGNIMEMEEVVKSLSRV
ncbi:hypothetical protein C0995_010702 [Termitomyces sp. Mi166|nr:hypothetical protein C0995_010702 [Termitomyces sp. Mi166\